MYYPILASLLGGIIGAAPAAIKGFILSYGYLALLVLMVLEAASLPIPSEIVLPVAGLLAASGMLNIYAVFAVVTIAGIIGISIDYYVAYVLGKDLVYRHLGRLRISKKHLDAFDRWFNENGAFTVFIGRMLPEVRGLVSLPAGFAVMPLKKFYTYSIAGMAVWDIALLLFGYYALNANSIYVAMVAAAGLAIVIYIIYKLSIGKARGR